MHADPSPGTQLAPALLQEVEAHIEHTASVLIELKQDLHDQIPIIVAPSYGDEYITFVSKHIKASEDDTKKYAQVLRKVDAVLGELGDLDHQQWCQNKATEFGLAKAMQTFLTLLNNHNKRR